MANKPKNTKETTETLKTEKVTVVSKKNSDLEEIELLSKK